MNEPIIGRELMLNMVNYLRIGNLKVKSCNIDAQADDVAILTVQFAVTQELLEALCKSN